MKKRIISLLLALLMAFSLLSVSAFALKTEVSITKNPKSSTAYSGKKVSLTTSAKAKLSDGEYLYYMWFDPDVFPAEDVIDIFLDGEFNGVISVSSLLLKGKLNSFKLLYATHSNMFSGVLDGTTEPNLATSTYSFTEKETRNYQCLAIVMNVDDMQELIDALQSIDPNNMNYSSIIKLAPIAKCEIYGYALSDIATVTLCEDHDYKKVETVSPTCTSDGYVKYTCDCGYSYTESGAPALGHNYINGKCTRCGDVVIDIKKQPADLKAASGTTGKFSVTASGSGLAYQWQYQKTADGEWINSTAKSAATATLSVSVREAINGYKYRCLICDADGNSASSSTAALTVTPQITKQPSDLKAASGTTGKLSIEASGEGVTYQWQYQKKGSSTWTNSTAKSASSSTFSISAREEINGCKYRCIVKNSCGNTVTSSVVTLSVTAKITKQPAKLTAASGTTGRFTITASGEGLTYQWQYQKKGSSTWTDSTAKNARTASFSVSVREAINGYKYRCIVKNSCGNTVTSNVVTLSVTAKITKHPANLTAKNGTTGKFTVTASGEGLTYQWQYQKKGSSTWTNSTAASAKKATLAVNVRSALNGYKYRCIVTNSCGNTVTTNTALLTVK